MRQAVEKETPAGSMLRTRQVADFLQVSICTIRRWSDKRMLKFYRIGSRGDRRYLRGDVLHFLEESSYHLETDTVRKKAPIGTSTDKPSILIEDVSDGEKKRSHEK